MTNTNAIPSTPPKESSEFSWDDLPEVAKESWEQMVAYSSTIESQLAKSKASREKSGVERQTIAKEVLAATKEACQEVVTDAKRTLEKIKLKTAEAEKHHDTASRQLQEAKAVRAEADAYRKAVLAQAEQQAEELLQRAKNAAEAEYANLKKQVSFQAQRLLSQAESLRADAQEELEAQRIYAAAVMLKADAHGALHQLKAELGMPLSSSYGDASWEPSREPSGENNSKPAESQPKKRVQTAKKSAKGATKNRRVAPSAQAQSKNGPSTPAKSPNGASKNIPVAQNGASSPAAASEVILKAPAARSTKKGAAKSTSRSKSPARVVRK